MTCDFSPCNTLFLIFNNPCYPDSAGGGSCVAFFESGLTRPDNRCLSYQLSLGDCVVTKADRLHPDDQMTDIYLLVLAVHERGFLVSFDPIIRSDLVAG